jgi:hypothetical protein
MSADPANPPAANTPKVARRMILQSLAVASGAAAATTAFPVRPARAYDPGPERRARYRETDHVKAFYRTNGYETLKK